MEKDGKMKSAISLDGQDVTSLLADEYPGFRDERGKKEALSKGIENGTILQFEPTEYTGTSTKTSRKDIEQAIITKSIQNYLGNGKQIVDITEIKDSLVSNNSNNNLESSISIGSSHKNLYIISCVENGIESYEMVSIGEDGQCKSYQGVSQDIFASKEMIFPTGMTTGLDKQTSAKFINKKQALETFKSKDGIQYSAYRDEDGILRVAQIMESVDGGKYAEELDTYSVTHNNIEKIKAIQKGEQDKGLTLQKAPQTNLVKGDIDDGLEDR